MAIVKRYNPNRFFFSNRLNDKLETIFERNLTVVEAPTGFGKTTSIRNLLNISEEPFIWINIDNENKNEFFEEFCTNFQEIDQNIVNKLKSVGMPSDLESCNKIINIISELECDDEYIIVLDNYQYIANEILSYLIIQLSSIQTLNFKFIILTQIIKTNFIMELKENNKINYIGKSDLEFTYDEIKQYFRECGIKLDDNEVNYLYKYTEGWISAVYLQMLHYINNNQFEPDVGIDKLVYKAIWDKLSMEEQDFLICISIFDSFSLKQAYHIGNEDLSCELIKKLLNSNSFIRYDSKDRKYYAHAILKFFLKTEFEKLDTIFKKRVYEKAAKWYSDNEDFFQAVTYYYYIGAYEKIYSLNLAFDDLLPYISKDNKEMFMRIISSAPIKFKENNLRRSMIFSLVLFFYNEKDFFETECNTIEKMITYNEELRDREREVLIGELKFIKSFLKYNDLCEIKKYYEEAYEYMKSPTTIFSNKLSLTFRNPSVLACFHRDKGAILDELNNFEQTMITYYKITSGNSKGLEALMRAEILYNACNFEDSLVLCQKALYMAETRNQVNVYICTMFLLARIAIFQGDYDNMRDILKSIRTKIESSGELDENFTVDLCEGYIFMFLEKCDDMPSWLKSEKTIEEKCTVLTLGFANLVYGKYLLTNEKYTKFLGISGQMLGISRVYNNIIYEIYTYIYISIANCSLGNNLKSEKFMNEAMEIAEKDNLIMPFIENYSLISLIMTNDSVIEKHRRFISKINSNYRKIEKEFKVVKNAYRNDVNYGLTKREMQVAKLAADRLTNKEIADKLYIAENTVKSNLKTIFSKLQVKSRAELKKFF